MDLLQKSSRASVALAVLVTAQTSRAQLEPAAAPPPKPTETKAAPIEEPPPAPSGEGFGFTRDEGFRLKSDDGSHLLRFRLQMALKLQPRWTGSSGHEFDGMLSFLRPILVGNLVKPWIGYRFSMEAASGSPYVFDAFVEAQPTDYFGVRFGQQGTPMSRHENQGPMNIFFPEYAEASIYFWSGRERGITVYGTALEGKLDYYAGVYGGTIIRDAAVVPHNYIGEARATVSPLGPVNANEFPFTPEGNPLPTRISFTAQGYYGKLQTTKENYNPSNSILDPVISIASNRTTTASGDLWFQTGPLILFGEYYWRRQDPAGPGGNFHSHGAWGQFVLNAYRNIIGVGGRLNWINPNTSIPDTRVIIAEGQVAWFIHAPELVLKLRYAWIDQRSPDAATLGTFQLPYPAGRTHLGTLQLNLFF